MAQFKIWFLILLKKDDKSSINKISGFFGAVNFINDRLSTIYLHTTVQGDEYFHQILAWTVPSKFPENKPILESVINSFQEN